jgi:hypothetical protein
MDAVGYRTIPASVGNRNLALHSAAIHFNTELVYVIRDDNCLFFGYCITK